MGMQKLSIIIVHYNQPQHLAKCFDSIKKAHLPDPTEIIVVDNGSRNLQSVQRICSNGSGPVDLICNRTNLGLARAANLAMKRASGKYLLNLNPDVQVSRDSVLQLERYLHENPGTGIVFPRLLHPDGSLQLSCRTHYDMLTVLLRRTPLSKIYNGPRIRRHLMADWDHDKPREIDWALGAAFMVRREALPQGRIFDDRYFLYMEDVDICFTLRQRGWGVRYMPSAVMIHDHIRSSATKTISRANLEHLISFIRFQLKHRVLGGR